MTNQLAVFFLVTVLIFAVWVQLRYERNVDNHSWIERAKVSAVSVLCLTLFILVFIISAKAYAGISIALFVFTSFMVFDAGQGLYRVIRNGCLNGWLASIPAFMWLNNTALIGAI